jgi:hypothetical protein
MVGKEEDMAQSHISILVLRKIVAGDRSRLVGSCYPGMNRGRGLCNSPGKRADQKFAWGVCSL